MWNLIFLAALCAREASQAWRTSLAQFAVRSFRVSDTLPRRWLEYQRTSREEMFDAWIQVDRAVREDPKEGWRLVLELVQLAAGDPVALNSIGAGPLEDLVRFHPNPFLDIAQAEARRNPPLADAVR